MPGREDQPSPRGKGDRHDAKRNQHTDRGHGRPQDRAAPLTHRLDQRNGSDQTLGGRKGAGHCAEREHHQSQEGDRDTRPMGEDPHDREGVPGAGASRARLHITVGDGLWLDDSRQPRRRGAPDLPRSGRRGRDPRSVLRGHDEPIMAEVGASVTRGPS